MLHIALPRASRRYPALLAALLMAGTALAQSSPAPAPAPQSANPLDWVLRPAGTPAPEAAEACALRPARVGVVKAGLSGAHAWTRQTGFALPLSLGYEHRLLPNTTLLATVVSVYDPWRQPVAGGTSMPSFAQFDVTTGIRYYLPVGKYRRGIGEEFAGAYVSLVGSRTFTALPQLEPIAGADYSYKMQRSNTLMAGYQLPVGGRGFLDVSGGLRMLRATSTAPRKFEPALGLTAGFFL